METSPMLMSGNLEENWKLWRKKFDVYLTAKDLRNEPQERLCAMALSMIGDEAFKIYHEKIDSEEAVSDDLDGLLEQLDGLFLHKKNYTYERFKLFTTRQHPGVSMEKYVKILKERAENCNLGELKNDLIKVAFIAGLRDDVLRSQLIRNDQMSLQDALQYCILLEGVKKTTDFNPAGNLDREKSGSSCSINSTQGNSCRFCGGTHPPRKCPAYGRTCKVCQQKNHFERMCRRRRNQNNASRNNE